jgi:hypothetical protein
MSSGLDSSPAGCTQICLKKREFIEKVIIVKLNVSGIVVIFHFIYPKPTPDVRFNNDLGVLGRLISFSFRSEPLTSLLAFRVKFAF